MALTPASLDWCPHLKPAQAVSTLPRLLELEGNARDIRCTAWETATIPKRLVRLLMNIRGTRYTAHGEGRRQVLEPGTVVIL